MFDERKTTQAAAYLLSKRKDNKFSYLSLIKLLYLSDKLSYKKYNYPITGDDYCSMKLGPVLSNTLDLVKEKYDSPELWNDWIQKDGYDLSLSSNIDFSNKYIYDELSESDVEVLDDIYLDFGERYLEFGKKEGFALAEYTHDENVCPEWDCVGDKEQKPIDLQRLLKGLEKKEVEIQEILENRELNFEFENNLYFNEQIEQKTEVSSELSQIEGVFKVVSVELKVVKNCYFESNVHEI